MSNWTDERPDVFLGVENLPQPIIAHMMQSYSERKRYRNVYHVTDVIYCLRKAYYRRVFGEEEKSVSSLWNLYRGNVFDNAWSPLFPQNQMTFHSIRGDLTLTGTLDFVWVDEDNFDKVLYDLKMPKTIFYRKKEGATRFYREQVQTYLALAHENQELLDVHRCRVMMLADDLVMTEVPERDEILDYIWERTFLLHKALVDMDSSILVGPEEKWECGGYCDASKEFRLECAKCPNYPQK